MIEWQDDAIILGSRGHGEVHAIVTLLSGERGVWKGLVHGGMSRRIAPALQPGNLVRASWRARLEDQLGTVGVELVRERISGILDDGAALCALNAVCAVAAGALPEREAAPGAFEGLNVVLETLSQGDEVWPALLIRWELGLLESLGFGLDLSRCAVTGQQDDLTHVSPRTGRAVCAEAAGPYIDKLLVLPPFLLSRQMAVTPEDRRHGLRLTGHFLARHVFEARNLPLPDARLRLAARFDPRPEGEHDDHRNRDSAEAGSAG